MSDFPGRLALTVILDVASDAPRPSVQVLHWMNSGCPWPRCYPCQPSARDARPMGFLLQPAFAHTFVSVFFVFSYLNGANVYMHVQVGCVKIVVCVGVDSKFLGKSYRWRVWDVDAHARARSI